MSAPKSVSHPSKPDRVDHPHGYNRLDPATGRISWCEPRERIDDGKRLRSRLETDDEVKKRIGHVARRFGKGDVFGIASMHDGALDRWIDTIGALHGIKSRGYVDEPA